MKLLRPQFTPPGGRWFYQCPKSGRQFSTRDGLAALVRQVSTFLAANKEPVPDNLTDVLEDYMCRRLPKGTCSGQDDRPLHEMAPVFFEVSKAMDVFFQDNRGKLSFCDRNEADKRMRQCLSCARHFMGICTTCDGLRATARNYVQGRTTSKDYLAGVCSVFRLPLSCIAHVNNLTRREGCPGECWVPT